MSSNRPSFRWPHGMKLTLNATWMLGSAYSMFSSKICMSESARRAVARLRRSCCCISTAMRQSYVFRERAFGVAQHYGPPSTGLDLTPDLDDAAFFALHTFKVASGGKTTITRVQPNAEPVILFMSIFEGDLGIDELKAPAHLITPRARAQKAHFFRTAWGAAPNRAAERIIAVLDLVDHSRWTLAALDTTLFPTIAADPFAKFLYEAQTRFPEITKTVPLHRVYFTT